MYQCNGISAIREESSASLLTPPPLEGLEIPLVLGDLLHFAQYGS